MTSLVRRFSKAPLAQTVAFVAAALVATASVAQFKTVGPDGKVTYSDRELTAAEGRTSALGSRSTTQPAEPDLPFELRQATSKYPVTLYTTTGACEPCASARLLLKSRGIPFSERQVLNAEDGDALQRLSGGREAPTLTIGSQVLRGLAGETWHSYLDAAGYPRESRLPQSYQYRAATPVVERREAATGRQSTAAAPQAADRAAAPTPSGTGGIRF
ncbi:MAG: glutaredoxin family protein [Caldimonas sp.]